MAAGHYAKLTDLHSADECCAACAVNVTGCNGWSFVPHDSICYLASNPQRRPDVNATCGCRNADCTVPCKPIRRPPAPQLIPLPSGIARRPNFISIIVDDLGWADTSLHNPSKFGNLVRAGRDFADVRMRMQTYPSPRYVHANKSFTWTCACRHILHPDDIGAEERGHPADKTSHVRTPQSYAYAPL